MPRAAGLAPLALAAPRSLPPSPLSPAYTDLPRRFCQLQVCPGDCSGAGTCHHSNGTCSCFDHRVGEDCSSPYCPSVFSPRCAECTSEVCTSCESGYFVDQAGGGHECFSCALHDPRCTRSAKPYQFLLVFGALKNRLQMCTNVLEDKVFGVYVRYCLGVPKGGELLIAARSAFAFRRRIA